MPQREQSLHLEMVNMADFVSWFLTPIFKFLKKKKKNFE